MIVPRSRSFLDTHPLPATLLLLTVILSLSACAKRARDQNLKRQIQANEQQSNAAPQTSAMLSQQSQPRININTASANELETLPGIGKSLAERIIEHREKYGRFRRPEHLIVVRGISDRRFRALRDLVTVE